MLYIIITNPIVHLIGVTVNFGSSLVLLGVADAPETQWGSVLEMTDTEEAVALV